MIATVIIYLIGILVTWIYAGFNTGRQFHRIAKNNPAQLIQINWVTNFYQGLAWPGFWASFVGEQVEKRKPTGPSLEEVNARMKAL